jgi:adenine phosphoribosyltransferase
MLRCSQSENAELFSLVIGGTAAAVKLLGGLGADIIAVSFLIELSFLGGRDKLPEDKVRTILGY